ncbi:MAG: GNAT family N-acetyltransferase [Eubacteriales bacterium]|nr:GNAT family N-acetyltransferase [Eubacteriales bacterium]
MNFRKAQQSDIQQITEIYERIHSEEEAGRLTTGWIRGVYPTEDTALTAIQRDDLFVVEEDGVVAGSAILNNIQMDSYRDGSWELACNDEEILVMHTLTIDPVRYGAGIGKAFVGFYESYAIENGCKALRIDTNERNTRARAMYKKCGFTEVGIVPCDFNGIPGIHLVLLEKPLIRPLR